MPSNHLILCCPLLLLPSIFLSIRVFSNESALHIRWPKYWSFSLNISPSNEHPGLISFRMDWLYHKLILFLKLENHMIYNLKTGFAPKSFARWEWEKRWKIIEGHPNHSSCFWICSFLTNPSLGNFFFFLCLKNFSIFDCDRSLLLWGLFSSCGGWASHCSGFSLWSMSSRVHGVQQLPGVGSVATASRLWSTSSSVAGTRGLVAPRHMGSSRIKDRTCVSCTGR